MYGGLVYASSNMMMSAAFLLPMAVSKPGTQLCSHESPDATELACMLCWSVGVNEMKFVPAFSAATTAVGPPERTLAHRAALPGIRAHNRNGQAPSPRHG